MPIVDIKAQLINIPKTSGIYKFFDKKDQILYIGKAKNLQKRLQSYVKIDHPSNRIARMVFLAQRVEYIETENEVEALLLEHNLIKRFSPRYNILLRDDKTFPYIQITSHKFPQITKYRGSEKNSGYYFGPFANAGDVNQTIDILRKNFLLRNCSDAEFKSRKKPCLEYQIKRCLAPCVGLVLEDEYSSAVKNAVNFLRGKSAEVQKTLVKKMQELSLAQEYEKAAAIRDQIKSLNMIQTKQNINISETKDLDIITIAVNDSQVCCSVAFYRFGQSYGTTSYFFEIDKTQNLSDFFTEFLGQFYLSQTPPSLVLTNIALDEKNLVENFLAHLKAEKVEIINPKKGDRLALIRAQEALTKQKLEQKILQKLSNQEILIELKNIFNLEKIPQRIEVYDNSHTGNTNAVGVLIVAGVDGFIKSGYRKFNIGKYEEFRKNKDDTAMMREVLYRRFSKLEKAEFPDFIIIDGGTPQLSAAQNVFDELKINIPFVAMAKGQNRNAGEEKFHQINREVFTLPKNNPVMYYLQRLRDEAHRFAIVIHRKKRDKAMLEI